MFRSATRASFRLVLLVVNFPSAAADNEPTPSLIVPTPGRFCRTALGFDEDASPLESTYRLERPRFSAAARRGRPIGDRPMGSAEEASDTGELPISGGRFEGSGTVIGGVEERRFCDGEVSKGFELGGIALGTSSGRVGDTLRRGEVRRGGFSNGESSSLEP